MTFPRQRSWRFHLSPAGSFKASPHAHPGHGSVDSRRRNKRGARGLGAPWSPPRPSGAVPQGVTHTVLVGSLHCWPGRPSGLWLPRSLRVGPARAASGRLGRWLGFTLSVESMQLWTTAVPLTSPLAQLPRGPTLRHRSLCSAHRCPEGSAHPAALHPAVQRCRRIPTGGTRGTRGLPAPICSKEQTPPTACCPCGGQWTRLLLAGTGGPAEAGVRLECGFWLVCWKGEA